MALRNQDLDIKCNHCNWGVFCFWILSLYRARNYIHECVYTCMHICIYVYVCKYKISLCADTSSPTTPTHRILPSPPPLHSFISSSTGENLTVSIISAFAHSYNTRKLLHLCPCEKHTFSVQFSVCSSFCLRQRGCSHSTEFKSFLSYFSFSSFSVIVLFAIVVQIRFILSMFIQSQGFCHRC